MPGSLPPSGDHRDGWKRRAEEITCGLNGCPQQGQWRAAAPASSAVKEVACLPGSLQAQHPAARRGTAVPWRDPACGARRPMPCESRMARGSMIRHQGWRRQSSAAAPGGQGGLIGQAGLTGATAPVWSSLPVLVALAP